MSKKKWDRDKVFIDLEAWVKLETSMNFNKFCAEYGIPPPKLSMWSNDDEDRKDVYDIAKAYIADRRERFLCAGKLHPKGYECNITVYDYFLKVDKKETAEFEANLKKENFEKSTELASQKLDDLNKALKVMQKENARNSQNSISKTTSIRDKCEREVECCAR
jgi:hypothetical protein